MNGDNILHMFKGPLQPANDLMQTHALRDCPFCGSNVITIYPLTEDYTGLLYYACCKGCYAQGAACKTEKEASRAWNRRSHESL